MSIIWGLLLVPSLLPALMSPMMFDSSEAMKSPITWLFFLSVITAPLSLLVACVGGLINSFTQKGKLGEGKAGKFFALLPLFNIIIFALSFILLDSVCNGEFNC